jgi:alpha-galactosidase/6-phospho-beta-glucosidase family protein
MATDTPTAVEVNCATGEQTVRPLTAAEIAQRAEDAATFAAQKAAEEAEAQAKADAKLAAQAKLQALGLTGEEIAAITE